MTKKGCWNAKLRDCMFFTAYKIAVIFHENYFPCLSFKTSVCKEISGLTAPHSSDLKRNGHGIKGVDKDWCIPHVAIMRQVHGIPRWKFEKEHVNLDT
jgi:hypothetical protein